ncbi:protein affecting phage T7 exclusion by the F plasmid [Halobacteroides halobius DSM 5150]|uniref:Protein affecting phage T7 exclusion by the F plasmid n=1 Tax=Halobacteroides halobius (strain ATCC 35273 / DSM 5150 / MD-1) TaxID=748449 RepID=L0K9U2_HALHC|nr:FxsA family protein [Halobacteroides halobius]AGB41280.1 protein affecting phage T7 exclusion by the F plasmid [Halobacteroides halobius DSM 5150]
MLKLVILFTIIPLVELFLLIQISIHLSSWLAIGLVGITGMLGAGLAKKQGTAVIKKINYSLSQGRMPADSVVDGLLILIGGVLLITPGLLTDISGFACILPFTRPYIKKITKGRLKKLIATGRIQFFSKDSDESQTIDIVEDNDED